MEEDALVAMIAWFMVKEMPFPRVKAFKRGAKDGSIIDVCCEGLKEMHDDLGEEREEVP